MSAIAGTYDLAAGPSAAAHPDAQHQQRHRVLAMLGAMPHRATDGAHAHSSGPTTLGHALRRTLPEDQLLPLSGDAATSADHLLLTAHVRIDNREALTQHLGLDPAQTRTWPDARFILAAYQRWGTACVDHLRGAFAFALWDAREHHLFLARDPFGLRPLYYHHDPSRQRFAFASEIKALLTLPHVPRHLNETRLAEYLVRLPGDGRSTIYQDIYRLEPGHAMLVHPGAGSGGELRTWRYFTLEADASVGQDWSDARYAEAFAEHFAEAVRVRLRSAGPVGSELSGGLDSSYVTFEAARQLAEQGKSLSTFSLVFDAVPQSDERSYMEVALEALQARGWPVEPHFVAGDAVGPLSNLDDVYAILDDSVLGGTWHLVWQNMKAAQQAGIRVLLDGVDGDTVVGHGLQYFRELARAGDWETFAEEAVATAYHHYDADHKQNFDELLSSDKVIFNTFGLSQLRAYAVKGNLYKFVSQGRAMRRSFRFRWRDVIKSYGPLFFRSSSYIRDQEIEAVVNRSLAYLHPDFVQRTQIAERLREAEHTTPEDTTRSEQSKKFDLLGGGILSKVLETTEQMSAGLGLESRHPFFDVNLVSYCLALPGNQSLSNGWTRAVMRRAMVPLVPDAIARRVGKGNLSHSVVHTFAEHNAEDVNLFLKPSFFIDQFLNSQEVCVLRDRLAAAPDEDRARFIKMLICKYWIERTFPAPEASEAEASPA